MKTLTPKRQITSTEDPIPRLIQYFQHGLTPTQQQYLHDLLLALITLGTLAQTQLCLCLASITHIAPNTWRQRLKRLYQQPFPEQPLFRTLLRLTAEWLQLSQVYLALDATTLSNRWTVLAISVVVHRHAVPIAWKVVQGNQKGAWLPLCQVMGQMLRGVLPPSIPVFVLTDRGLWSPELFRAIRRNGWHPLMRVNAQGHFRPLWARSARPLVSFVPACAGQQRAIAGEAFAHRLRCTLVVFWGRGAKEPWYLLTDLGVGAVGGAWYGYRAWIEQGFRWLKRGGFGWHRCRLGRAVGVCWMWLVYALGCLLLMGEGLAGLSAGRLWDRRRRSVGALGAGRVLFLAKCLGGMGYGDREIQGFGSGGEPD